MKQYRVHTLIFVFVLLLFPCLAQAEEAKSPSAKAGAATTEQDLANKFVGTWKLVSIDERRPNGEAVPSRYGTNPIGFIMYDAKGRMAVQIMSPNRSRFASAEAEQGSSEEIKAAFDGYAAYFGTYEVNEAGGFVIHHVEGSLFPNYVGTDQKRFFELSGDQLVLKPPPRQVGGEQLTSRITWQRVR